MNIAVVGDMPKDAQLLVGYLKQFQSEYGASMQIQTFYSSVEFLETYDSQYDIVFLDIEMPGSDGSTTAREIRSKDGVIRLPASD